MNKEWTIIFYKADSEVDIDDKDFALFSATFPWNASEYFDITTEPKKEEKKPKFKIGDRVCFLGQIYWSITGIKKDCGYYSYVFGWYWYREEDTRMVTHEEEEMYFRNTK